MNRFKAVFFDMDGVLYDSMPNHEFTWCHSFADYGITFNPEDAYINEGRTGKGTINLVFNKLYGRDATDAEVAAIYGRKTELMKTCPVAPMMTGMKELVEALRTKGVKTYVVTGSKQPTLMDKLWNEYGFDREHIVCGADVVKGKPDPEPYLIALWRSGEKKEDCAVVENAPMGVMSAKAAGLFTIAVNTGKLEDHYLTDNGCDMLYGSTEVMCREWIADL
ncbi:MAG: HAD family phosphatase [Bacteroidales bacterium]|nr:HAD family phosphatase [Bacteroidales bacterium]